VVHPRPLRCTPQNVPYALTQALPHPSQGVNSIDTDKLKLTLSPLAAETLPGVLKQKTD
jgi:hypothetical protein